jgi:hypothetical protein
MSYLHPLPLSVLETLLDGGSERCTLPMTEDRSLQSLFLEVESRFESCVSRGFATEEEATQAIDLTEQALVKLQQEAIFSKNEEFDDISTSQIKYKFINYYLASFYSKLPNQMLRLNYLNLAKRYYLAYLEDCQTIGVLDAEDARFLNSYGDGSTVTILPSFIFLLTSLLSSPAGREEEYLSSGPKTAKDRKI